MAFERLNELLERHIPGDQVPGGEILVWQHGKELFRKQYGYRDYLRQEPMAGEEFYFLYSCTKVLTCASILHLLEEGKLSLDDPLAKYIPAFGEVRLADGSKPKNPILIRHCFAMTSGMDYELNTPAIRELLRKNPDATAREMADAIAKTPLGFEPGSRYRYSLSHDVLAAVAEEITGKPFGEYIREWAFEPLGIKDAYFEENEQTKRSMAAHFTESKGAAQPRPLKNSYILSPRYHCGGAGLITKPREYIKFISALAMGGQGLLKPETVELFKEDQQNEQSLKDFRNHPWKELYTYGLGVRVKVSEEGGSPIGEFGWDGAAGSYLLVDTENELAVFYAQHVTGSRLPPDVLHPAIRNAVYEDLGL